MLDEIKLNVNPPTDQKPGRALEVKFHWEEVITTGVRVGMKPNEPESEPTSVLAQPLATTAVAEFTDVLFKSAVPLNPILPVMGVTCTTPRKHPMAVTAIATLIQLFFILYPMFNC